MGLGKGTMVGLGGVVLALTAAAWITVSPPPEPQTVTVYASPT